MPPSDSAARLSRRLTALLVMGAAVLFVASSRMPLLYHQNQNTKFLHGLARAFPERLGADWTAGTVDGLPAFTALVHAVAAWFDPVVFYVFEAGLLALMCVSLIAIARQVAPRHGDLPLFVVLSGAALAILVHPPQEDSLRGVAGQYMSEGYLQPSEFGILYLPALYLAMRRHPAALLLVTVPAVFHPAYIAFSVLALAVFLWDRHHANLPVPWALLVLSVLTLALPPLDLAIRFRPTDAETFVHANEILAFERIPHHSDPRRWADFVTLRKTVIALLALALAPRGVLRLLLVVLFAAAFGGAAFVALTGNAEVALMAPWRASIIIVPVAAAVLMGRFFDWVLGLPRGAPVLAAIFCLAAGAAALDGLVIKWRDATTRTYPDYVARILETETPSDIYLTDPRMSDFRLAAMAAQFVSWKTHPYLDTEVIEWNRRVALASAVFDADGVDCAALDDVLATYPVTKVLVRTLAEDEVPCAGLAVWFRGRDYTIFEVVPPR